jgi:hypothetical protein
VPIIGQERVQCAPMMRVAPCVCNGTPGKTSLGVGREGYNRLMNCASSGQMRDRLAALARATVARAAAPPSHASRIVGAKDKSTWGAVR